MFLSSLIEELCTKEENNEAACTLTFGGQCNKRMWRSNEKFSQFHAKFTLLDKKYSAFERVKFK